MARGVCVNRLGNLLASKVDLRSCENLAINPSFPFVMDHQLLEDDLALSLQFTTSVL